MIRVCTLDYSGFADRARVATLLADRPGVAVLPLMTRDTPHVVSAHEYAEALLARSAPVAPVHAVLAYCMAAPIAYAVARLLTVPGRPPPTLITLDGSPCPAEFVRESYRDMLARFAAGQATQRVQPTEHDLADRAEHVLGAMADELTGAATRTLAAELAGGPSAGDVLGTLTRELVASAMRWLTTLVAAHNTNFPGWPGTVVSIVSRTHPFTDPWPGARVTTVVPVACTRAELLAHPDTRHLVTEVLAGRRTTPPRTRHRAPPRLTALG